jgi:hypothetical protein
MPASRSAHEAPATSIMMATRSERSDDDEDAMSRDQRTPASLVAWINALALLGGRVSSLAELQDGAILFVALQRMCAHSLLFLGATHTFTATLPSSLTMPRRRAKTAGC